MISTGAHAFCCCEFAPHKGKKGAQKNEEERKTDERASSLFWSLCESRGHIGEP